MGTRGCHQPALSKQGCRWSLQKNLEAKWVWLLEWEGRASVDVNGSAFTASAL